MSDLLVAGGFRLRTDTLALGRSPRRRESGRADCARCTGHSRGTVSYNSEVAHCFRCGWSANRVQLARELRRAGHAEACRGISSLGRAEPRQANACPTGEQRRRAKNEKDIHAFACWREARLRWISDRTLALSRAAERARRALASGTLTPDEQELAWDALARFYHEEARLGAAFDLLTCAKAGAWLEGDAGIEDLFELWRGPRAVASGE